MNKLSFRYCPICGRELDTGKAYFPEPRSIFARGSYYFDKLTEELDVHPVKKFLGIKSSDKSFITVGDNPAGYCEKCARIFVEFKVRGEYGIINDDMDYYDESADNLYDDSDEKI